jgi:signal transduction histidine kinase
MRAARGNPLRMVATFSRIAIEPRAYARALYLFLSLPLGGLYFAVLAVGAFCGAALSIVLIGLILCVVTLILAYIFAAFDRELVIHLLGVPVPPMSTPEPLSVSPARRLVHHLRRRNTWTGMVYLCLLGPFGAVAWTVGAVLIGLPLAGAINDLRTVSAPAPEFPLFLAFNLRLVLLVPLAAVFICGLHLLDLMGRGWGHFAASMLSTAHEEIRVAQAEQRAESAERGRRELILNVSHELRTPIASIQGHLDTLLLPGTVPDDTEAWRPYVKTAASEAKRLGRLVDELLILARADADTLRVDVMPVRVQPVLEGVVAALQPLAKRERSVTIVCRPPEDDYWVLADSGRLTQVLTNLARNAITHTPPGGAVALSAATRGPQQVELAVADTGVGVRPDELGRIFERFYRADSARGRDSGGFGLGLAIAKDLVEAMGGTITATSEVGIGTTIRVMLRRAAPATPPDPPATSPTPPAPSGPPAPPAPSTPET